MAGAVDEKATRRSNGNVRRMDISRQGPARDAAPNQGPRGLIKPTAPRGTLTGDAQRAENRTILGAVPTVMMAGMFPQAYRNWQSSDADAGAAYAAGDTSRALGASVRKLASVPAGLAYDLAHAVGAESDFEKGFSGGVGRALGGLLSSDGSTKVSKAFTPPATGKDVVASALTAGKTATSPLTPAELMQAALLDRISGPMTRGDMTRYTALLPAPTKPQSEKDKAFATTGNIADSIYQSTLAQIAAAKKSGTLSEEDFQAQNTKAVDKYFANRSALLGVNQLTMAQAAMMPQPDEEDD